MDTGWHKTAHCQTCASDFCPRVRSLVGGRAIAAEFAALQQHKN